MKLQAVKEKLLLLLLCGGLSIAGHLPATAQVSPTSPPSAIAVEKPARLNHFPYGLFGLLGLLGLAGLWRRKDKSEKKESSQDRPPAPPGSYVRDVKADRHAKP